MKLFFRMSRERERERERKRERCRLDSEDQPALLIIDDFRGQMIQPICDHLKENNTLMVRVPSNMTLRFHQTHSLSESLQCRIPMKLSCN